MCLYCCTSVLYGSHCSEVRASSSMQGVGFITFCDFFLFFIIIIFLHPDVLETLVSVIFII